MYKAPRLIPRTPAAINLPDRVTPDEGTILGRGEATPGLILIDSLITPVCMLCQQSLLQR